PALSAVSPSAAKRPVPIIIAAVRSIAVVPPRTRREESFDLVSSRFATIAPVLRRTVTRPVSGARVSSESAGSEGRLFFSHDDLRGLDDSHDLLPFLEAQSLGRLAGDRGRDLL